MAIFHSFLSAILLLNHLLNKTLGHAGMNVAHGIVEEVILWCSRHAGKLAKGLSYFPTSLHFKKSKFSPSHPIFLLFNTHPPSPASTDSPFRGEQIPAYLTSWVRSSQSRSSYFTSPREAVHSHHEDKSRNSAKP